MQLTFADLWLICLVMVALYLIMFLGWFLVRRPLSLWDITENVGIGELKRAKKASRSSDVPVLPKLAYTEERYKWVLLYDHARAGQIVPSLLKRMRRVDLEYLAGMDFPHPDLTEPRREEETSGDAEGRHAQITKLQGNVSRAKAELHRRNLWNTTVVTVSAVLGAGILGATLASLRS